MQWLLVFSPVLLSIGAGIMVTREYLLSGGQMLFLGILGVFPLSVWNVETHVAGGWRMYQYPTLLGGIINLAVFSALGVAGAWLGHQGRIFLMHPRGERHAT